MNKNLHEKRFRILNPRREGESRLQYIERLEALLPDVHGPAYKIVVSQLIRKLRQEEGTKQEEQT